MKDRDYPLQRPLAGGNDTELPPPALRGYKVARLIASGGASRVYEATQRSLERPVAIKVLRWRHAADEDEAGGFEREIALLARLDHPNLVGVIERGQWQGQPYCVMERVDGASLAQRSRAGALSIGQLIRAIEGAAAALAALHEEGIVHRDVKPGNILVPNEGPAKLADLGTALLPEDGHGEGGGRRGAVGTAGYMAPEQANGSERATPRSDIHAFAAMIAEAIAGVAPSPGQAPVKPSRRSRLATRRLDALLARAMSPDPAKRPESVEEFARECVAALAPRWAEQADRLVADARRPAWFFPALWCAMAFGVAAIASLGWLVATG